MLELNTSLAFPAAPLLTVILALVGPSIIIINTLSYPIPPSYTTTIVIIYISISHLYHNHLLFYTSTIFVSSPTNISITHKKLTRHHHPFQIYHTIHFKPTTPSISHLPHHPFQTYHTILFTPTTPSISNLPHHTFHTYHTIMYRHGSHNVRVLQRHHHCFLRHFDRVDG